MDNEIRPPAWFALVIAAAMFGAFVAVWLTDFAVIRADWCSGIETICIRDWIGATSGWVAALAAAATIYVLLQQLQTMRRQTEFVVGDAPPTLAVVATESFGIELRLVNWNRHTITLNIGIMRRPDGAEPVTSLEVYRIENKEEFPTNHDTGRYFPTELEGWEDRTKPPPVLILKAAIGVRGENIRVICSVDITINDANSRKMRLEVPTTGTWELNAD